MIKTIATLTFLILAGGCSATQLAQPTHYWEGEKSTAEQRYTSNEAQCRRSVDSQDYERNVQGNTEFLSSSEAFAIYKECMLNQGYVLRTY